MPFIIGFILLIFLIGFIASGKFQLLAQSKGYVSVKAKKYPWFIAGATFFLNTLGQTIFMWAWDGKMLVLLFICWGCLAILIECAILYKAYRNMQAAPNKGDLSPAK